MPKDPDLEVFVEHVSGTATTFFDEASEYSAAMPRDGAGVPFGCPRGGTALFDHILENTLRMIGELHTEIGQAMENHGFRLRKAAEQYSSAESRSSAIIGDIFDAAEKTPIPPDEPNVD